MPSAQVSVRRTGETEANPVAKGKSNFQHASISYSIFLRYFNLRPNVSKMLMTLLFSGAPLNSDVEATVSIWQLEISAGALPPVSIAVPWSEGEATTWYLPTGLGRGQQDCHYSMV